MFLIGKDNIVIERGIFPYLSVAAPAPEELWPEVVASGYGSEERQEV